MKQRLQYPSLWNWLTALILFTAAWGCQSAMPGDPGDPIITSPPLPCDTSPVLLLKEEYYTPLKVYLWNVGEGVIIDDTIQSAVYFSNVLSNSFEVSAGSLTEVVTLSHQSDSTYHFKKTYTSPHRSASVFFNCVTGSCTVYLRNGGLGFTELAKATFQYK